MKSLSYGLSLLSLALVISTTNSRLLDLQGFVDTIRNHCYNVTSDGKLWPAGQLVPLASSIENFISLVEKLERTPNSTYGIETTIQKLTAWFTINDLEIIETSSVKKIYRQNGKHPMITRTDDKLINNFLLDRDDFDSLNEAFRVYSENEVCSLYYMLSHTVNSTDANRECFTHGKRSMRRSVRQLPSKKLAKCSLEQGVVSVNSEEDEAVAINRVLFGIYAGARRLRGLRPVEPLGMKRPPNEPEDLKADPLPAFTVGALLGRAVLMGETTNHSVRTRIGHPGIWNSTQCATEFELDKIPTGVTTAEAKGAVDGLILGTALRYWRNYDGSLPSLSQILRMYYKKHRQSSMPSEIPHYCDRQSQLELALKNPGVERYVENMAKTFYWHATGSYPSGKTDYRGNWNDARREFDYFRNNDLRPGKACEMLEVTTKTVCDTPSNVFMVLDERASMEEQRKLAANLANRLDLDEFRGSISIVTNKFSDGMPWGNISWNATSSGCPGCRALWYSDEYGSKIQEDGDLLKIINRALCDLERRRLDQTGVGSKVLLYLKYGDQIGGDSEVYSALNRLREYHKDLAILGGLGDESGRRFLNKIADSMIQLGDTEQTVNDLKQAICEVPALLQWKWKWQTGNGTKTYEGFVVPDAVQYWAMYPHYFLNSSDIRFYFQSENGNIEVCYSRSAKNPEKTSIRHCSTLKEGEIKEVEFQIRNSSDEKTVENFAPIYFSVVGIPLADESRQNRCFDPRCKTSDAIKFTIRFEVHKKSIDDNSEIDDDKNPTDNDKNPTDDDKNPIDDDKNPTDNDKNPTDDDKNPTDDDKNPIDDDKKPTDDDKKPTDDDKKPTDDDKNPTDDDKNPTDDDKNPTDDDKNPTDDDKNPTDDDKNKIGDDKNPNDDDKNPIDDDKNPIDDDKNKIGDDSREIQFVEYTNMKVSKISVGDLVGPSKGRAKKRRRLMTIKLERTRGVFADL